jgi:hypothetical protein
MEVVVLDNANPGAEGFVDCVRAGCECKCVAVGEGAERSGYGVQGSGSGGVHTFSGGVGFTSFPAWKPPLLGVGMKSGRRWAPNPPRLN